MSEPLYQLAKPVTINEVREQGKSLEWNVYMPDGDVHVYYDESEIANNFRRIDLEELDDDDCGHDSMDGDGHGNWVCMCCKNTYSDHKDSAGFTYLELVREGHEHDFAWTFRHCRYCDKKIDVRVDPEELKTQLREELEQFYQLRCGWANGAGEDSDDEKWTDDTVDRVISLFFPVVNQETSDE